MCFSVISSIIDFEYSNICHIYSVTVHTGCINALPINPISLISYTSGIEMTVLIYKIWHDLHSLH